jgi:hypothetical protein
LWSAVDNGHVAFVVALASGRREVVQPLDLLGAQFDALGGAGRAELVVAVVDLGVARAQIDLAPRADGDAAQLAQRAAHVDPRQWFVLATERALARQQLVNGHALGKLRRGARVQSWGTVAIGHGRVSRAHSQAELLHVRICQPR